MTDNYFEEDLDDSIRVRSVGKQVLLDDEHFADAVNEDAAAAIAAALQFIGLPYSKVPQAFRVIIDKVLL